MGWGEGKGQGGLEEVDVLCRRGQEGYRSPRGKTWPIHWPSEPLHPDFKLWERTSCMKIYICS